MLTTGQILDTISINSVCAILHQCCLNCYISLEKILKIHIQNGNCMDLYWKQNGFLIIHNNCIFQYYGYSIEIVYGYNMDLVMQLQISQYGFHIFPQCMSVITHSVFLRQLYRWSHEVQNYLNVIRSSIYFSFQTKLDQSSSLYSMSMKNQFQHCRPEYNEIWLSYQVNGDWQPFLSIVSAQNIFVTT